MAASGGRNVIGSGAVVDGTIERTVLWPEVHVASHERLIDAIRARNDVTLYATSQEPADVS
jgi:MurNAc alpha-1-phosphate uridylyltransferase